MIRLVSSSAISSAARYLIGDYEVLHGLSPKQVNAGLCGEFAEALAYALREEGELRAITVDGGELGLALRHGEGEHVWVYLDGRHYDAEAPEGVSDWRELPFFRRNYRKIQRWRLAPKAGSKAAERELLDSSSAWAARVWAKHEEAIRSRVTS